MEEETKQEIQEKTQEKVKSKKSFGEFHDKNYKLLLLIPLTLFLFSIIYEINFYNQHNDFMKKDISLTGGTTITINSEIDANTLKKELSGKLEALETREIYDILSNKQKAVILETTTNAEETRKVVEEYLGYSLTEENSSTEFTGSTLSKNFYNQLILAMIISFILMAIVIFLIFRIFVPSFAVIFSAFADIIMTLVMVNLLGMNVSSAGIVAFLMLIGYSVDTDILLTNRVLKGTEGTLNNKIYGAFKTGITMTLIAILSVVSALLIIRSFSEVLSQIFTIIFIGLMFDLLNTWVTNVSILKWYVINKQNKIK